MADRAMHYLAPKLEVRRNPKKGGYGVFTSEPIAAGELILVWGGDIVTGEQLAQLSPREQMHSLQVEENLYQVPSRNVAEPGDFVNHCCDPNAGLSGQIALVAMRDITTGEEICFDYAMSDGSPYDEFTCACGTPHCRGQVTAEDWRRPELQARYAGFFSPYLQRRIDRPKKQEAVAQPNGRVEQRLRVASGRRQVASGR
jgi:hypothetical protein